VLLAQAPNQVLGIGGIRNTNISNDGKFLVHKIFTAS
jgi:hypothetical protein